MSNHLAVATVTAVLRKTLQDALDAADPQVPGARVTTTRPNAPAADLPNPGANIFLYQTTPSAALRAVDLPTRRGDSTIVQRPQVALDLHYLITFHGTDARLEQQVILGIVTRALHETPVVTRASIEAALADPVFDFLAGSDLAEAVELARFSPVGLSVEEMAKLWSIFYQIPYVLSIAYRASVVLIESETAAHSGPPVRKTRVRSQASLGPSIDDVVSAVAGPSIVAGQDIVVVGQHLQGPVTRVRFDSVDVVPDPAKLASTRIQVTPPALSAGPHTVQVIHRTTVEASTNTAASEIAMFALRPMITPTLVSPNVRIAFTPAVGRTQRVSVLLNETPTPVGRAARSYVLHAPLRAATDPATATTLDVPLTDVAPGGYLVRVQVDGVESPLAFDAATGVYNGPKLTVS